jgi:8-oxo-dGTP pyrophosphatase MutT (NUDIX family)
MRPAYDDSLRARLEQGLRAFERETPALSQDAVLKHAAVAITVIEADDLGGAAFVLTRRTSKLRNHAGQWALPGGRLDEGETPVQAALRELHEEVGLPLGEEAVLGVLDDYITRSGYLITPVVVWAGQGAVLVPNPDEVAHAYRIGMEQILAPDAVDFIDIPESDRPVVRVAINGDRIHAPTAAVVYQFRELAAGRVTRVHHLEQPVFAWR